MLEIIGGSEFTFIKGENDSDRIAVKCLRQIAKLINGKTINISGKKCKVKVIGGDNIVGIKENELPYIMVDVKDPSNSLDHIEFIVEKTGWGTNLDDR